MKKANSLLTVFWALCFITGPLYARIGGLDSSPISLDPSSINNTYSSPLDDVSFTDNETELCDLKSAGNYVSQEFLRTLVLDPQKDSRGLIVNPVRVDGKRKFEVKLPSYVSACTQLRVRYAPPNSGNDHFIRVQNVYDFSDSDLGLTSSPEDQAKKANMSISEKHEVCLRTKGLIDDNDKLVKEKITRDHITFGSEPIFITPTGSNRKESVNLYYISPKATEYGIAFPASDVKTRVNKPCIAYENINGNKVKRLLTSERDRRYDEAMRVCENRNPQEIIDEIARNYKDGHDDIAKILERVFVDVKEDRLSEIYARMDEIELELRPDEDGETVSKEQAVELVGEYSDLAEELQNVVVSPGLAKIRELLAARNPKNKVETDKQIKELQEGISEFGKRSPSKTNLKFVYQAAEKYALTKEIRAVEDLRLSSHYYGRVGRGKGDIKLSKADRAISENLINFERDKLDDWKAVYSLRNGNDTMILALEYDIRGIMNGLDRDFEDLEKENSYRMNRYCSVTMIGTVANPGRCQDWQQEYQEIRESLMYQRDKDLAYVRKLSEKHQHYVSIYEKGMSERESDDEMDYDGDFEIFGQDKARRDRNRRERLRFSSRDSMSRAREQDMRDYERQGPSPMAQQFPQQQWGQQNLNQFPQGNGPTIYGPHQQQSGYQQQVGFNLNRSPALQRPNYGPSYTSYMQPNMAMMMNNGSFMNHNTFQTGVMAQQQPYFYGQQQGSMIFGPGQQHMSRPMGVPQQNMQMPPMGPMYNFRF